MVTKQQQRVTEETQGHQRQHTTRERQRRVKERQYLLNHMKDEYC